MLFRQNEHFDTYQSENQSSLHGDSLRIFLLSQKMKMSLMSDKKHPSPFIPSIQAERKAFMLP